MSSKISLLKIYQLFEYDNGCVTAYKCSDLKTIHVSEWRFIAYITTFDGYQIVRVPSKAIMTFR